MPCMHPACTELQIRFLYDSIVHRGLKCCVTSCTMYLPVYVMNIHIFWKQCRLCNVQTTYIHNDYCINMYIHCIYMIMHMCSCIYTFILYIYHACIMFLHGIYRSKKIHPWYLQLQTRMYKFFHEIKKNCIIAGFEPMTLCILNILWHY